MQRWIRLLILTLLLALTAVPALAEFMDARDVTVTVDAPQRVVCLYGSYAEAWALAGGTLVGVTDDAISERSMELGDDVQIIGTTKDPNLELILALEPDLVIASADLSGQVAACETLQAAGIPCAAFRVDTYQEYAQMMEIFTTLTGRPDLYEAQIPPMIEEIEQRIADAQEKDAPTVLLIRAYSTGAKAKGADNLAGVMLQDLGCDNIADRVPSLLEELTLESIVAEDPDFIFVSIMGSDEEAALAALDESLGQNPAWQQLSAIQADRMIVLPKELFHYKPNSRWSESYAYLSDILFAE